jgi:hypothetical protein
VRKAAAMLVAVTSLVAPAMAHAGWNPARATSHDLRPLAVTIPDGVFSVWGTTGSVTRRITDPTSSTSPGRVSFPSNILSGPWLTNRRGDVLLVDRVGGDGALLVETTGTRVAMEMEIPRRHYLLSVAAELGEDGSAVVAWTAEGLSTGAPETVWVRVRPPGGQFGPRVALRNPAPVIELDVDLEADGRATVVYSVSTGELEKQIVRSVVGPEGLRGEPTTLATEELVPDVEVVAGRVLYDTGSQLTVLHPTGGPQRLESSGLFNAHRLADDGVVLAYFVGRELRVRRAAPGAPFGTPQRVTRLPRGSTADTPVVTSSSTGALLIAWRESISGPGCVRDWCFDRVLAASAEPGQPLGPPQLLTPLGTRTNRIVAALADDGRRLVAWLGAPADAFAPDRLVMAGGNAATDPPAVADLTPPRVRVLRNEIRGGKLRVRLRSNEAVAVRTFVGDTSRGRAVVLPARRSRTFVWSLTRYQRAQGSVRIVAADAAGNVMRL